MSTPETQLEHLFPTTILMAEHPEPARLNAALLEHVAAVQASDPEGRKRSNILGWQSDQLDRSLPAVQELGAFVVAEAAKFGQAHMWDFKQGMNLVMPELWVNVNGRYAFNQLHVHPNSLISGVYYAKVPEGSAALILHDPRKQASVLQPALAGRNFRNVHQYTVEPKEGRLVLFPGWLEHGVAQHLSDEERVSFSFNIDQTFER